MSKLVLFSQIFGIVTLNGTPLENVEAKRTSKWAWSGEKISDTTKSNSKGEFTFPMIEKRSFLASWLPHEPYIDQQLSISYQGTDYKGWVFVKRDYEVNGELNGKPLKLRCALELPPVANAKYNYFGICTVEE